MISEPFIVFMQCIYLYLYMNIKDSYKFLSCAAQRHFIDKSRNMVHM